MGCATAAGGIAAVQAAGSVGEQTPNDINPQALVMAGVSAALAAAPVWRQPGDAMIYLKVALDVIVANPPWLMDADERFYRRGGGAFWDWR